MPHWIAIAIGGATGALLRVTCQSLFIHWTGFPALGTMVVNLTGSLLIGVLWALFDHVTLSASLKVFLITGLLGAFTTFSTFSLDLFQLLSIRNFKGAFFIMTTSVVGGACLVWLGYLGTRRFF